MTGFKHGTSPEPEGSGAGPDVPVETVPTIRAMERELIAKALRLTGGHRGRAAAMLGISERNLYRKIRAGGCEKLPDGR